MGNSHYGIRLGGTARSPEDVRQLHNLGLQFAEIPITDPHNFSGMVGLYNDLRENLGLYYLCHGPREGDPNDTKSLEREYFPKILQILPLMNSLEMSLLSLHLWLDPRFVKEETIRYKIDLLKQIIDRAKDMGIMVCLENLSESASHLSIPFQELPSLYLTLDMGHGQLLSEVNRSFGFIDRYPERIKHIHLHDNRGGDSHLDDLHLPPGQGIIPFEKIFKQLRVIGYNHTMTLELKTPEIEECLGYIKGLLSNWST